MKKPKPKRGRPRKPAACVRSTAMNIRLTAAEHAALRAAATAAQLTVTDLIVARCCREKQG